ncbi:MAG: hypothetical protein UU42_C0007G0019 [Candidatus Woesebacteria bacterium GW2011_GWA1_41_13b]|uniref:Uncharacterized protein n=1 Tax=Candidatus Woesebacteria bacterium GW2011_GWA1_41_13b TaxID=1618555 RepID=A0A0G0XV75_9BACT|nr:MAG: hypothetical protein UU42_C0007G0019 [Candidatus Woesebacteria bacterium GW2011_GWA1_41_13b]
MTRKKVEEMTEQELLRHIAKELGTIRTLIEWVLGGGIGALFFLIYLSIRLLA